MTALNQLIRADDRLVNRLGIGTAVKHPHADKFDNRPTRDNASKKFDNRPTWDNWNKR
jgi:hypothetical protein